MTEVEIFILLVFFVYTWALNILWLLVKWLALQLLGLLIKFSVLHFNILILNVWQNSPRSLQFDSDLFLQ